MVILELKLVGDWEQNSFFHLKLFCMFPSYKEWRGHTQSDVADINAWELLGFAATDIRLQWKRVTDIWNKTEKKTDSTEPTSFRKMTIPQPANKFLSFYGNLVFIAVFKTAIH